MISRLTGTLVAIDEGRAEVAVGALTYELLVPAAVHVELQPLEGREMQFFTLHYLEGNLAGGNLVPRLIGFLRAGDREFFRAFTKVRNVGMRKALRAMSVPVPQIARAIEAGDERLLSSLPEIGKRTAAQVIAQLRGSVEQFALPGAAPAPATVLTEAQRLAAEILIKWGDRRVDVERWIREVGEQEPGLSEPDEIVTAAYRRKAIST